MIFSSGLGSVEKQTTDVAIKNIANHLRKLQDELEYRLSNLDSSNINEIDTDETVIRGGTVTLISQTADEIAELKLSNQQLTASVQGLGNTVSSIQMQAGNIQMTVENLNASMSQTLRVSADGVTITNASGSKLTIDGGQIDASKINTGDLNLTGKITFADLDADTQAKVSSSDTKAYLESIGVTEITVDGVKSPRIEGGEVWGTEIYGGLFSDLEEDNYFKVFSGRVNVENTEYMSHFMVHYVGDASDSVPLTAMGWFFEEGVGGRWVLRVLNKTVLEVMPNGLVCPRGAWDFSGTTVNFAGATVLGL